MSPIATVVALILSGLLLWAGTEKLRDGASVATTLRRLGVGPPLDRLAGVVLAVAEVAAGLALLWAPQLPVTHGAVAVLAGSFGLAGAIALLRRERIACSCLGSGRGSLGWTQIGSLPLWWGATALVAALTETAPSPPQAAARFAAVALGIATLRGLAAWRERAAAIGDRLTTAEILAWPPSP